MTTDTRRCTSCGLRKHYIEFFAAGSTVCLKCQRKNRRAKRGLLEITCTADGLDWHVKSSIASRTSCGQPSYSRGIRAAVKEPGCLTRLMNDPACCERCRAKLGEVFG